MKNESLNSHVIRKDDTTISYLIGGTGPCLIFLHGYMETKEVWLNFADSYLSKYQVVIPDLPGHGQTSLHHDINSMENMADAVITILIRNSIKKAILIGHSMGGYVALALLDKNKSYICGVGLLNSLSIADSKKKIGERLKEIEIIQKGKKNLLIKFGIPNSYQQNRKDLFKAEINNQIQFALAIPSINLIATIKGLNVRADRSLLLSKSNIPYIILQGQNDKVLPTHVLEMENQIHSNNFLWVDNCAHICFIEQKSKIHKIVLEFLHAISNLNN